MKRNLLILSIIGMVLGANAQRLTVDSCKALALRNNATVKSNALEVEAAKEVKRQAFTKYFPNVSVMAGGYYALNPLLEYSISDLENAAARDFLNNLYFEYGAALGLPNTISLCENGLTVGVTAIQPIYMGGQIIHGNKLAQVGVQAATLQYQLSQEEAIRQVEESYWLVVSLYEKRVTLQQALIFLDTLFRDVEIATEAGLATSNDLLKVTLKQNEMRSNLLKVENGITLSTMALCQSIGIPYSTDLLLTDTLSSAPDLPTPTDNSRAVAQRKESQLLLLSVEAEQLHKKITIGETLPHLMVGAGASYGNLVFDHYNANGLAFATLQVPITNWWETAHKINQQNINIKKAELQRTDLIQKMELETQQTYYNVVEAAAQITLMEETVQEATANLKRTRINYEAGLIAISELLEAQTLLRQSQDQLTDARIDMRIKQLKYDSIR